MPASDHSRVALELTLVIWKLHGKQNGNMQRTQDLGSTAMVLVQGHTLPSYNIGWVIENLQLQSLFGKWEVVVWVCIDRSVDTSRTAGFLCEIILFQVLYYILLFKLYRLKKKERTWWDFFFRTDQAWFHLSSLAFPDQLLKNYLFPILLFLCFLVLTPYTPLLTSAPSPPEKEW